jgi:hypothetical protein
MKWAIFLVNKKARSSVTIFVYNFMQKEQFYKSKKARKNIILCKRSSFTNFKKLLQKDYPSQYVSTTDISVSDNTQQVGCWAELETRGLGHESEQNIL